MIDRQTPVVFLHAYPLSGSIWGAQTAVLADRPTLAPNFPGFGGRAPAGETLDDFAEIIVADMDAAGIERAVIVGLSMGGYVAFRLHARWRERVAGLVLADTRASADTEAAATRRAQQAKRVRNEGLAWLPDALLPDLLGETTRQARPELVDRVRRSILGGDPEGIARALLAMRARPDSTPTLHDIDVPVLAIAGAEDTITPVAEADIISESVPQGALRVIPHAGHLSNLENPAAFNEAISEFLRTGGAQPSASSPTQR